MNDRREPIDSGETVANAAGSSETRDLPVPPGVLRSNNPVIKPPSTHHETVIGEKSSLARVGFEGGVTLDASAQSTRDTLGLYSPVRARSIDQVLRGGSADEKYIVEEEIARGGMGVILRAVDRDVRREVAMKLMRVEPTPEQRARFVEEAQVLGQLEHPNIVPIHELGVDAVGRLFFSMKLVRGKSLAEILAAIKESPHLARDTYALPRLLQAFLNVCNAVDFAHSKGVVHRDLKPANIMLGSYGEVLVMDWGLAKVGAVRKLPPAQGTGVNVMLRKVRGMRDKKNASAISNEMVETFRRSANGGGSQDGVISGTPAYMPPEQARGETSKIDERSDTYALGAILYEILTLLPPVSGDSLHAVLTQVVQGNITPPEQAAPGREIPKELSAIAMLALSNEPDERYQTVELLRRDVELFLEGHAVSAKPDSVREAMVKLVRRHRGVSIVTALASVVLAAVIGFSYYLNRQERIGAEEGLEKVRHKAHQNEEKFKEKIDALEATVRQLKAQAAPQPSGTESK